MKFTGDGACTLTPTVGGGESGRRPAPSAAATGDSHTENPAAISGAMKPENHR